jgi:triacylglycerol lipase
MAATDADQAEAYALDAIDFARAAIDEAQSAAPAGQNRKRSLASTTHHPPGAILIAVRVAQIRSAMSQAQINTTHQSAPVGDTRRRHDGKSPRCPIGGARALVRKVGRAAMVQAYELGLMASLAATVPVHLFAGGTDPGYGALPRFQAAPAATARPVLLVHGFGGTKSCWSQLARTLRARGVTFDAITYAPFGTSIEQLADRLAVEVKRMLSQTGADKLHLVGHSLGGVVIAQALATGRLTGQIDTVVTLGAPFGGSPWAQLLPFGAIVRALREGSPLLRRLASAPAPDGVRWLAFTAAHDLVVPGGRSVPAHADAETVTVGGVGHLGMLLSERVVGRIAAALPA